MGFLNWITRRKRLSSSQAEAAFIVDFDDKEIRCKRPNGDIERIPWHELRGVLLRNTDEGPFVPDVFWVLVGNQGGCVIPQGATGEDLLLKRLQELPGFNNEAVIASAACTDKQDFVCWEKKDS